jgi:transcription antitermination factor NusG
MNWYAIYTKPRNEKKVAEQLEKAGIIVFCPLVTRIKQWSDRKKKVIEPLLPSYVFVQMEEANRNNVFQVNGVVQFVFWLGKPAIIKDHEIESLKEQLINPNPIKELTLEAWTPNTTVLIEEGLFKGQEAIVKSNTPNKVHLVLKSLNMHLIIER